MEGGGQPAQASPLMAWLNAGKHNHSPAGPPDAASTPGSVKSSQPVAQNGTSAQTQRQRHTPAPPIQTQPIQLTSRVAVVLTSSPNRIPDSQLTQTTTLPRRDLSEMAKRVKKNLGILIPKPTASAAQRRPGQARRPSSQGIKVTPVPLPIIPHHPASPAATPPQPSSNHRGRPKGWKPGMSYAAMRGNTPPTGRKRTTTPTATQRWKVVRAKAPQAGFARRPGRPPRAPSPHPQEIYHRLESRFVAFLCEWAGCEAELHNLDTLRRHVYFVHGKGYGHGQGLDRHGYRVCRWAKCGSGIAVGEVKDGKQEFRNEEHWRAHVDEVHLIPFGWHVGDGPQNTSAADQMRSGTSLKNGQLPEYLLDSDGHQVTPSIREQELEDFATWRENRRKLKDLLERRDENLQDETSESSDDGQS